VPPKPASQTQQQKLDAGLEALKAKWAEDSQALSNVKKEKDKVPEDVEKKLVKWKDTETEGKAVLTITSD